MQGRDYFSSKTYWLPCLSPLKIYKKEIIFNINNNIKNLQKINILNKNLGYKDDMISNKIITINLIGL